MKNRIGYIFLVMAFLCTALVVCHGRVFERAGAIADSTRILLSSGGALAYETSISVNGGKGELSVVGFNKSITRVVRELAQAFNTKDIAYSGGSMGYINVKGNGMFLQMTVLKLGKNTQTLVFKIQQTEAEHLAALQKPNGHMLKDIPAFPGSDPVFFARDDKSNAGLAVAETSADAPSVRTFFAQQLSSAGWAPALPGLATGQGGPSLMVFNKNREICCVLVDSSQANGKNLITLLHKQQGIE